MTETIDKTAKKFREMAAKLVSEIAAKRRDRDENTPKKALQAAHARIKAAHLDRVRLALVKLADAREAGTLPSLLSDIVSKADLLAMLRTRLDTSGGYYSIRDTGEFPDKSAKAVALREFLEASKDAAEIAQDLVESTKSAIAMMEQSVAFRPIAGFFPTPPAVCDIVRERANLNKPFLHILEPSAGKGDLAGAMYWNESTRNACMTVHVCEINHTLREILKAKGTEIVGEDFLALQPSPAALYDRVVMNPPFERGQDMDHVRHAYGFLAPGGRLVSVMSTGPFFRSDRKATEFRAWLESVGGEKEDLPGQSFKGGPRSTGVSTCLVVIDREEKGGAA